MLPRLSSDCHVSDTKSTKKPNMPIHSLWSWLLYPFEKYLWEKLTSEKCCSTIKNGFPHSLQLRKKLFFSSRGRSNISKNLREPRIHQAASNEGGVKKYPTILLKHSNCWKDTKYMHTAKLQDTRQDTPIATQYIQLNLSRISRLSYDCIIQCC